LKFHEVANIFPLLEGEEYRSLVEDIKINGLLNPIWTYKNEIIDGRNRFKACRELNIEPKYQEWNGNGSLVGFVLSLNLHRRHLTPSQKSVVAIDILPMLEKEARERQGTRNDLTSVKDLTQVKPEESKEQVKPIVSQKIDQRENGRATEQAAKLTGTNRQYVSDAKKIKEQAPELLDRVREGKFSIPEAKILANMESKKRDIVIEKIDSGEAKNIREASQIFTKENVKPVELPEEKFNVILADPPWKYDFAETENRAIENQYPTMSLEDIKKLEISSADNAVLFLWTTAPKLIEGIEVMKSWGFNYKTCAVWDKEMIGMGYWFRGQHELLLVGTRGQFSPPTTENRYSSVIRAKRTTHSRKPEIIYEMIEKMFPEGKYLELFARNKYNEKWTVWGNQVRIA
jgi:N6-adenosine-specific RNA methylase IME4/stress response protein YsnF